MLQHETKFYLNDVGQPDTNATPINNIFDHMPLIL